MYGSEITSVGDMETELRTEAVIGVESDGRDSRRLLRLGPGSATGFVYELVDVIKWTDFSSYRMSTSRYTINLPKPTRFQILLSFGAVDQTC